MVEPFRPDRASRWWGFGALAPLALVIASLLVVIATITGYAVAANRTPTYAAQAATLLDQPLTVAQSQDAGVVDKLSRLRLKYAGILKSDVVVKVAATATDLPAAKVADAEFARIDQGSLLLYVGATASTESGAERLADALAQALASYVAQEQVRAQIAPRDRVSLQVVAPARTAVQVLPTRRQKAVSALSAGIVAFVVLGGALDIMRRRRR
ncbi:MAG: hypothetical protein JF597_01015 [Streptomyces sp.]|uniref:hypothetical protein n=1 Tax=Streptomyces sp. TaxID=1931 RepID=UPI0025DFCE7A|nr:hypothetical protein [Streptomyces sp.]MBW8792219.1 hypothetical protein [Streptomyces sp.]